MRGRRRAPQIAALVLVLAVSLAVVLPLRNEAEADPAAARVKSGTGFFVSTDGFLVTSAHVVADCPQISVWAAGGTQLAAHLIAANVYADIALLWVDGSLPRHPATFAETAPQRGEAVFTVGFGVMAAEPLHPVLAAGTLIGGGTAASGNRVLTIRARLLAGTSGGPVVGNDGSLVGMVIGRDEQHPDLGVAIPNEEIAALLAPYGIAPGHQPPAASARDRLLAMSALVQCAS